MDLKALQATLRQFAAERDWKPFHTPKNLAMALMVEAAELAEIFQWMTPEESQAAPADVVLRERVGDELADVLLYQVQVADHTAVDLKRAVGRKLMKNASKHPPLRPGQPAGTAVAAQVQTHVLVDWENVQPRDQDIRGLVPDVSDVWLFHGPNQKKVTAHHASFGDRLTAVPIARAGKNALDFHLSFYMGYITSRHPEARIVVISNDQGYGPMLDHAQDLGFAASQLGFAKKPAARKAAARKAPAAAPTSAPAPAPAKKVAAKKAASKKTVAKVAAPAPAAPALAPAPARKAAAKKTAPAKKAASKTSAPPAPVAAPPTRDKDYEHVLKTLRKTRDKPARQARFQALVRSLIEGGKGSDEAVAAMVARLVRAGVVNISDKGAVSYTAD